MTNGSLGRCVGLVSVVTLGLGWMASIGLAPAREAAPAGAPTTHAPADRPVLWIYDASPASPAGDADASGNVRGFAEALRGVLLPGATTALGLDAPVIEDRALLQVGLNISALRREDPDAFLDNRLNEALHALGIANAREVVVSVRPAADERRPLVTELLVSYRSRPPGEFVRFEVSMAGPRLGAGEGIGGDGGVCETWIRPRWAVWLERCVAFHRATRAEADRAGFDAVWRAWRVQKGPVVRGVFAALEGPIVVGSVPIKAGGVDQSGREICVLIGLGSRADAQTLVAVLPGLLGEVCSESTYDDATGIGRVRVDALAGTAFERLGWSIISHNGRRWMLVAREGSIDALRREFDARGGQH